MGSASDRVFGIDTLTTSYLILVNLNSAMVAIRLPINLMRNWIKIINKASFIEILGSKNWRSPRGMPTSRQLMVQL